MLLMLSKQNIQNHRRKIMAVTWTIPKMDRDITQGDKADVITTIHWIASETDSDGKVGLSQELYLLNSLLIWLYILYSL